MKAVISKLLGSFVPLGLKGMVVASAIGLAPAAAFAGHHDDFRIDVHIGPRGPLFGWYDDRPRYYEDRDVRVWVEPVYRTVCDRVWCPDRYEDRDVVEYYRGYRRVIRERVLVERGHYQDVPRQELVVPGHWETHIEHVRVR